MMSIFWLLAARVRTALVVLNSKYFPGLRMLAGIWSKEMFVLAIYASSASGVTTARWATLWGALTSSPLCRRRR